MFRMIFRSAAALSCLVVIGSTGYMILHDTQHSWFDGTRPILFWALIALLGACAVLSWLIRARDSELNMAIEFERDFRAFFGNRCLVEKKRLDGVWRVEIGKVQREPDGTRRRVDLVFMGKTIQCYLERDTNEIVALEGDLKNPWDVDKIKKAARSVFV